jgi:hypothetical protein
VSRALFREVPVPEPPPESTLRRSNAPPAGGTGAFTGPGADAEMGTGAASFARSLVSKTLNLQQKYDVFQEMSEEAQLMC